ncbi:Adaptin ear-binding coat-associated protein 1 NECAP-1 isoform 1 [Hibiscus syriacus]|uniref:Adaptin ear-binding coat-associated protein 1 NECAP-1 isoform 1 n=1 Tax=Hibiscus syriacus TaxID=106335 RepID=A0A6A2ZJ53_HIBSY|nr:Adaptin ear-binding coat-associated protein 1 NECAP-1 isoform 1 [Hibiscus syriacus]
MVTMDLKGITWVGHVYQEFESMCLEAEEVMYQDTVKYVEDQVQTVGASVKKFYSDVMQDMVQDLLLPSSLEPKEAVAASDTPVEENSVTLKKPNVGLKEAAIKSKGERLTEYPEVIADVNENAANVPSSSQLHMDDNIFESCNGGFVERAFSDLLSGEHSNNTLDKPNIENLPLARASEFTSVENEFRRMTSFSGNANANHEFSCHQSPTTLSRVLVNEDGCDSVEGCNEIESASESTEGCQPMLLDQQNQMTVVQMME